MISLVKLDAATVCLHRMEAGGGSYVCRAPLGHSGPHDYLPIDMVIVVELAAEVDASPVMETMLDVQR